MTPLMLSKRWVSKLGKLCDSLPPTGHSHSGTHPMNWHTVTYAVPSSLIYHMPPDAPKKLCLRSSFKISVNSLAPGASSHKQCQTELSQYWLNVCNTSVTLQYTDPRRLTEHTVQWEPHSSFILSTAHAHSVHNHSDCTVKWISIHTGWDWHSTATHYQHQW